jgi:hypothetical protein
MEKIMFCILLVSLAFPFAWSLDLSDLVFVGYGRSFFDWELDMVSVSIFVGLGVIALKLFLFSCIEIFGSVMVFSVNFLPGLRLLAIAR